MTSKGKDQPNKDPRSELGYRLTVQVDAHDAARPLAVVHVPSLGSKVSTLNKYLPRGILYDKRFYEISCSICLSNKYLVKAFYLLRRQYHQI